ncbi:MAG TPA: T9SS type A sorting domain-containing protein [Bacteroidales bacterium]|nr:T9SS type A sorting domain-containing protein [Bacteroidales bacterium]
MRKIRLLSTGVLILLTVGLYAQTNQEKGRDTDNKSFEEAIKPTLNYTASEGDTDFGTKDSVILDDQIILGSLGVGSDCVDNEMFGFNTILLKENNVRMKFEDTSTSGSFPSNDWTLIANDSANEGDNYFAVEDATAVVIPFKLMAGAPANSLFVGSTGNVGIGTDNPMQKLHVMGGMKLDAILTVPGSPEEGFVYMDGNDNLLKYYNGTAWQTVADKQSLTSATLTGSTLQIDIENGSSVSVDLSPILADLEARLSALEGPSGINNIESINPKMSQNSPNPFAYETSINFYIPNEISNASITIYDIKGSVVKEMPINQRGEGDITVTEETVADGTYFYSLILDGRKADSKIMIKAK